MFHRKNEKYILNADTSQIMKNRSGAHDWFIDLLDSYSLNEEYIDLFKFQIEKLVDSTIQTSKGEVSSLKQQLSVLKNKREKLEERYVLGDRTWYLHQVRQQNGWPSI